MTRLLCHILCALAAGPALSDTIVATRTIRANQLILASDLAQIEQTIPGTLTELAGIAGQEARTNLYAGRPLRPGDIGPPAIVERNQLVTLVFAQRGLTISVEGRALERGGIGDRLRAMNLSSRNTVTGEVAAGGFLIVRGK